jgi:hypothetical protein
VSLDAVARSSGLKGGAFLVRHVPLKVIRHPAQSLAEVGSLSARAASRVDEGPKGEGSRSKTLDQTSRRHS